MDQKFTDLVQKVQAKVRDELTATAEKISKEIDGLTTASEQQKPKGIDQADLVLSTRKFAAAYSQVDLLNLLVDMAGDYVPRALLLIRKSANVHGWAGRGFSDDFSGDKLKRVRWEMDRYPELARVIQKGEAFVANFSDLSNLSDQISAFDGFVPLKSCFFPVRVKGKVAAVLYCDSGSETRLENYAMVEMLVYMAGLELTVVTAKLKAKPDSEAKSEATAAAPAPEAAAPAPAPPKPQAAPAPTPAPTPEPAPKLEQPPAMAVPDTAPVHPPSTPGFEVSSATAARQAEDPNIKKAKRVARVLVSDLKLYNEAAVQTAMQQGGLYQRLREDIDRSYKHYQERVESLLPGDSVNYFKEELIRQLTGGDASKLGSLPF